MAIEWHVPGNASTSGSGWNQVIAIAPFVGTATNPLEALYNAPMVASENVIEVMYNSPTAPQGFSLDNHDVFLSESVTGQVLSAVWVISEFQQHAIALENIETGTIITISDVFTGVDPETGWYSYESEVALSPGKYRLIYPNENLNSTVYLTKVCVHALEIVVTSNCGGAFSWVPPQGATTTAMAAQVTAVYAATHAGQAQTTSMAYAQWAATATPRAAATQTAVVASGNTTSIAQTTHTQAEAPPATRRYVATQTP